jgi:hypothetical protein
MAYTCIYSKSSLRCHSRFDQPYSQSPLPSPAFKAKVGLEAIRGVKTVNEIGQNHGVLPGHHPQRLIGGGERGE